MVTTPDSITPQQRELLQHEEFISSLERIRSGKDKGRSKLLEILNSSAATTIITVVLGGLLGNTLVSAFQSRQKQNEVAQEQYQTFLQKQRDVVDHAIDLVGAGEFDSERLLALTQRKYNVRDSQSKVSPELQKWRAEVGSEHDSYLREWQTGSLKTGVLLDYYFLGGKKVAQAWGEVAKNVEDLENCAEEKAESANQHGPIDTPTNQLCVAQQTKLKQTIEKLSENLNEARSYAWQKFSIANGQ